MHDHTGRLDEEVGAINNFWMYFSMDEGYPRWASQYCGNWDVPYSQACTEADKVGHSELKLGQTPSQFFAALDMVAGAKTDLEELRDDIKRFTAAQRTAGGDEIIVRYQVVYSKLYPIFLAMLDLGYTKMDLWK